jgi:hypothetical protein
MADLWRDFRIRETGTGQQVAQLHDKIYDDEVPVCNMSEKVRNGT